MVVIKTINVKKSFVLSAGIKEKDGRRKISKHIAPIVYVWLVH
jgi:hypothetical protein